MPNHSRDSVEKNAMANEAAKATIKPILCGIAGFTVKFIWNMYTNQKLDNEIDILKEARKALEDEFCGSWKNSKKIKEINTKIVDLMDRKK
jgi:hypothetical protein